MGTRLFRLNAARPPGTPPRWFGEYFRRQLCAQLDAHTITHKISAFLWSGANSIHERDAAAAVLARQLAGQIQTDPDSTHVIIAQSHGGNAALRALDTLRLETANVRLVTLATPFLDFFPPTPVASKRVVGVIEFIL